MQNVVKQLPFTGFLQLLFVGTKDGQWSTGGECCMLGMVFGLSTLTQGSPSEELPNQMAAHGRKYGGMETHSELDGCRKPKARLVCVSLITLANNAHAHGCSSFICSAHIYE